VEYILQVVVCALLIEETKAAFSNFKRRFEVILLKKVSDGLDAGDGSGIAEFYLSAVDAELD